MRQAPDSGVPQAENAVQIINQCCFPDTGIAAQNQHPAASDRGLLKQLVNLPLLRLPPGEHAKMI
jgi:hypothetical protein